MREFIINELRKLNVINDNKLLEYVDFCFENKQDYIKYQTALHHILPRAKTLIFSNFSDINENKWNCVHLSYKNHYLAHYLLCLAIDEYAIISAFIGMHNKDIKINRIHENVLLNSEIYDEILKRRSKHISLYNSNKVVAKNLISDKTIKVSKEEFDNDENLVGATIGKGGEHWKGKITVLDKEGNRLKIYKEEFDNTKYFGHTKGFGTFKDKEGNIVFANTNDPRVLSGDLVGFMKGTKSKLKGTHQPGQRIKIHIFDKDDILRYECYGNYQKICDENDLPIKLLSDTIKNNSVINFDFKNKRKCDISRIKNSKNWEYIGWYARKIKNK